MQRDSADIARRRATACTVMRGGAIIYSLFGLAWTGTELIGRTERLIGFVDVWWYGMPVVFMAAFFLAPAALLMAVAPSLARWVVPVPERGCPNCGYSLDNLRTPTCPECGGAVGPERTPER